MPNTLAHVGIQGMLNAGAVRTDYLSWALLSCAIPDIPFIINRLVTWVFPGIDPYVLQLYVLVQASLFFAAFLCLAAALFAKRIVVVFAILFLNCTLHLLLDATEIKPGNGVHLFAPVSWQMTSFELVWPEHWAIQGATFLGALLAFVLLTSRRLRMSSEDLVVGRLRASAAVFVVVVYVVAPLSSMNGPYEADNRGLQTLTNPDQRIGKPIELDRDPVQARDGRIVLTTSYGEELWLVGENIPDRGVISLRGYFVDSRTINVTQVHRNSTVFRDLASVVGLIAILAVWIRKWVFFWRHPGA